MAETKHPDWNDVYRDCVKPPDIERANELVPVTRESLRLCVGLLVKCMAEDYYHNFGAAHAEICAALDDPSDALAEARAVIERLFPPGDEPMEKILWGDMPNTATGTITTSLGTIRAARAWMSKWGK